MNTSQLECFVRVAETFSFQQAAEDLHISQPAVSKQIAALENEMDAPLFIRTTRTVALTPIGEKFLADAKRILQMTYHARQMSASAKGKDGQTLRIGYTDNSELFCMTRAFERLREKYPDFLPMLTCNKWDINTLEVEHGRLDVCFSFKKSSHNSHIVFQQVGGSRSVCVMHPDHPLAGSSLVRYEQIKNEPMVCVIPLPLRNSFYSMSKEASFPVSSKDKKLILCDTISEGYALVMAGFGSCLLPDYLSIEVPGVRVVPCDYLWSRPHGVYYHDENFSPLLKIFLNELKNSVPSGPRGGGNEIKNV